MRAEQRSNRQQEHTANQRKRQDSLELASHADTPDAEYRKKRQRNDGQQNFTSVNAVTFHRIEIAPLGQIWEEITADERQSSSIQGHDGKIGKAQEPRAQKTAGGPKRGIGKGEFATRYREMVDHIAVIEGNNDHNDGARSHSNKSTQRPGIG